MEAMRRTSEAHRGQLGDSKVLYKRFKRVLRGISLLSEG